MQIDENTTIVDISVSCGNFVCLISLTKKTEWDKNIARYFGGAYHKCMCYLVSNALKHLNVSEDVVNVKFSVYISELILKVYLSYSTNLSSLNDSELEFNVLLTIVHCTKIFASNYASILSRLYFEQELAYKF